MFAFACDASEYYGRTFFLLHLPLPASILGASVSFLAFSFFGFTLRETAATPTQPDVGATNLLSGKREGDNPRYHTDYSVHLQPFLA